MRPILNHQCALLPFFNQMWIALENNLDYFLLSNYMNRHLGLSCALWAKHFLINIYSNYNMKHPIWQPLEHWLQINVIAILINCSHNIPKNHVRTTTKDGSFLPSTLGKWYDVQLSKWSFHFWQFWTSNNNTLKHLAHIQNDTYPINIFQIVYIYIYPN